jgi:putative redox protein
MEILVNGISGKAYRVTIGNHELVVDQPYADGGEDLGPTPADLFVASLASCAAYYAGKFLARHGVSTEDVAARCSYRLSPGPPVRVESIAVALEVLPGLPVEVMAAALRSAEHCTVHNSLSRPPQVTITLGPSSSSAAA